MTEEVLGTKSAFTVICKELQKDDKTRYTTAIGLRCMLSSQCLARSPLAFDTKRKITALLRRDKLFDDAAQMARNLIASDEDSPEVKSDEVRDRAVELAHVFMDIGELEEAKELCRKRMGNAVAWDGLIGHEYHDQRTRYALKDLAKIEEDWGNLKYSAIWLGHAADLAKLVQETPIVLIHILDKLDRTLRLCGQVDEAGATLR